MTEFSFIKSIPSLIKNNYIGDDCAIIPVKNLFPKLYNTQNGKTNNQDYLLISSDTITEGIHFSSKYFSLEDIGFKSLAVNLSDIAACGGKPTMFNVNISVPKKLKNKDLLEIYKGFEILIKKHSLSLIGGDTVKGDKLSISITIFGTTKKPLLRTGAKINDNVYITGELGMSSYALKMFNSKKIKDIPEQIKNKHLRPMPKIEIINELKNKYQINACIDISDGFSSDLNHLLHKNLGCRIYFDKIPINKNMKHLNKKKLFKHILHGGEDFELIIISPDNIKNNNVYKIGKITSENGILLIDNDNEINVKPSGFDHFVS